MQFESAVRALRDAKVEFVIIGGLAATFHGSASITFDLDICYSTEATNLSRLAKALAPFHPRLRGIPDNLPFIWDTSTLRNGSLFTLKTDLGDIDLLGEVTGLGGYAEVKAMAIDVEIYGGHVSTLNLRGLIQAKRAAGRAKDLLVLPELESLLEAEEP
jgi:predicted nucleotidyltransferase